MAVQTVTIFVYAAAVGDPTPDASVKGDPATKSKPTDLSKQFRVRKPTLFSFLNAVRFFCNTAVLLAIILTTYAIATHRPPTQVTQTDFMGRPTDRPPVYYTAPGGGPTAGVAGATTTSFEPPPLSTAVRCTLVLLFEFFAVHFLLYSISQYRQYTTSVKPFVDERGGVPGSSYAAVPVVSTMSCSCSLNFL